MTIFRRALQKIYNGTAGRIPVIDRFFRYRNPNDYWTRRGGDAYFQEQEAVKDRTERSLFIVEGVSRISPGSLLEVGCGYGKQLQSIQQSCPGLRFYGCDFSRPQILKGVEVFPAMGKRVVEADAECLPFKDKSFDAVMTSAVILHNEPAKARRIISELVRVSRKYLIHNEDTDVTFSRFGYNMAKTYQLMGFKIIVSKQIPCSQDPAQTQFSISEIPSGCSSISFGDIPLQYFKG